jgi:uncharacterized protein (DUF1697 family)
MPQPYLALLRKINVGGINVIKMNDLKTSFEKMNFTNVKTYIQSGNVIFNSPIKSKSAIKEKIDTEFAQAIKSKVKLLTLAEIKEIITDKPKFYGAQPDKYRYTIIFLIDPLKPKIAIAQMKIKDAIDKIDAGKNVLYVSQLKSQITKSHLPKIVGTDIYQNMTLRTWSVVEKLCTLMQNQKQP